ADDRGYAELARDDRGMAGASAAVRDDRGRPLHHGFPVGIRHVGHEHVALLHATHLAHVADHLGGAGADLLADAPALAQYARAIVQGEALHLAPAPALHRFR